MSDKKPPSEHQPSSNEQTNFTPLAKRFLWADSASSVERVIFGLGVLCAILFVLDFIIHRHAYAPGEGLPGFYAVVGFGAFTIIVLGAAQLRRLILRNEQYYSPNSVDAEHYPEEGLERLEHTPEGTASMGSGSEDNAVSTSGQNTKSSPQEKPHKGDSA